MLIRKNIHNMSQGRPNPGFMQEKVQKGDFLKKSHREVLMGKKKHFCIFTKKLQPNSRPNSDYKYEQMRFLFGNQDFVFGPLTGMKTSYSK